VDDFCDTHTATVIHPTAPVAGALFAYAGLRKITGHELLLAFVLGNEVQDRIGLAISPSHYNRGWHITSTCGVFGAATAIGKLAALDERQMVWALGNAATQSAGLCECLGTPAKSVSVGNAARNGLWSALLAEKGYDGPVEPLAGVQGFYNALAETPDLSLVTDGWGDRWEIMATSYKPYPCGFVIHPVLDCVLDWRRDHATTDVARVVVRGNPLLSVRADRPNVSTGREAQVSVQHAVAAALIRGQAGLDQFTDACVNDPEVLKLRSKVEVLRDESFSTVAAAVEIATGDGKVFKLEQKAARGSEANPLSDRDLENKLRTAASLWNPRYDATSLIDAIWDVESSADVSTLTALTVPR
jgi:2-methylcitrate dehydratase PrpD